MVLYGSLTPRTREGWMTWWKSLTPFLKKRYENALEAWCSWRQIDSKVTCNNFSSFWSDFLRYFVFMLYRNWLVRHYWCLRISRMWKVLWVQKRSRNSLYIICNLWRRLCHHTSTIPTLNVIGESSRAVQCVELDYWKEWSGSSVISDREYSCSIDSNTYTFLEYRSRKYEKDSVFPFRRYFNSWLKDVCRFVSCF